MPITQSVPQELWETVEALKGVFGDSSNQAWNSEQLDFIAKTFGVSSNFHPYDLSPVAYFLQPVFSPLRNRFPRLHLQGANMQFKSVFSVDTSNVPGVVAEGQLPASITTQFADVTTYFKTYGVSSDPVTWEQLYVGAGRAGDFNVDSRAIAVANLLKAMFIKEERMFLGGVGSAQQVITSNTSPSDGEVFTIGGAMGNAPAGGTLVAQSTGGSIPDSTTVYGVYTAVSATAIMTGMPTNGGQIPYLSSPAGQSKPSSVITASTGTGGGTNAVVFTPPSYTGPVPILGWVLYLGASDSGPFYAAGFTTGAPLTVKSVPTSGMQPPSTDNTAITQAQNGTGSSVEGSMNGVLAWLTGTNTGATVVPVNGALDSLDIINNGFTNAFSQYFADPDEFWVSPADIGKLTKLLVGNNGGQPYWFAAQQGIQQGELTANFRVSRYLNPVTSKLIPVDVHAYLPQGTMLALTTQLPAWYVGNNVPDVWIWGGVMDYLEVDYQPTPNFDQWISKIQCLGAIHCFLPNQNLLFTGVS